MNIGSLIRGLLGDNKAGEAKSLELKEGQVVRGVVLSVSESGKEALVQIQGTPVRAELETPLQPGQTLNLQVSPPGEGGLPILKPVSLGEAAMLSPQSMGEALETLGLTDAKAGREIVQAMQSGGLALTKETAAKLNAIMNAKPATVPTEQWLEAAVISVKRGLPVTVESVKGLQQAVFGPQLHQLLSALEEQVSLWAGQKDGQTETANGVLRSEGAAGSAKATTTATVNANNTAGTVPLDMDTGVNAPKLAAAAATGTGTGDLKGVVALNSVITDGTGQDVDGVLGTVKGAGSADGTKDVVTVVNNTNEGMDNIPSVVKSADNTGTAGAAKITGDTDATGKGAGEINSAGSTAKGAGDVSSAASAAKGAVDVSSAGSTAKGVGDINSAGSTAKGAGDINSAASAAKGAGDINSAGGAERSGTALLAKLQGVLTELRGTLPQLATVPPAGAAGQEPAPAAGAPRGDSSAAAAQPQQGTRPTNDAESWVGRVLKLLGAEHEQQAVRGGGALAAEARPAAGVPAAEGRQMPLTPAALGASVGEIERADTLKGVLLQILGSSEIPPALKEAAGQLVQHMTGQQLLLNTDRTAPFAQVTLFLPLQGSDGEETASVHIQSRRGRKGELDAANCRLWFDLNMKQLGQTLVDVQVVDHIVSLKLHNNDPEVLELLEDRRDEIKTAVESIGYQLSGLRTEPLPVQKLMDSDKVTSKLADFVPDSYKGVDYRI